MKRIKQNRLHLCNICQKNATEESLEFHLCQRWTHIACIPFLSDDDLLALHKNDLPLYCPAEQYFSLSVVHDVLDKHAI